MVCGQVDRGIVLAVELCQAAELAGEPLDPEREVAIAAGRGNRRVQRVQPPALLTEEDGEQFRIGLPGQIAGYAVGGTAARQPCHASCLAGWLGQEHCHAEREKPVRPAVAAVLMARPEAVSA